MFTGETGGEFSAPSGACWAKRHSIELTKLTGKGYLFVADWVIAQMIEIMLDGAIKECTIGTLPHRISAAMKDHLIGLSSNLEEYSPHQPY